MRSIAIQILILLAGVFVFGSCTPIEEDYENFYTVDLDSIAKVNLAPNHLMVLADGHAQLELNPTLYTNKNYKIPDSRVKEEWLEYICEEGLEVSRRFSTDDAALIGKEFHVKVRIKGTDLESNTVKFTVAAPLDKEKTPEIVIPVVMHLIQTNRDIEELYSNFDQARMQSILDRINNIFGGKISRNATGVNTNIRFEFAQYAPNGKKMLTPGITSTVVEKIDRTGDYSKFILDHELMWPADKYMNIWFVSYRSDELDKNNPDERADYWRLSGNFGYTITNLCVPRYVNPGIAPDAFLPGLGLAPMPAAGFTQPNETGMIFKLEDLDVQNQLNEKYTNDIIYYFGRYLGLLNTNTYFKRYLPEDYCFDTMKYMANFWSNREIDKNQSGCSFVSENIMDDCTGLHCSITRDQCLRMHWVLQNCPERSAWKSKFAFTGQN